MNKENNIKMMQLLKFASKHLYDITLKENKVIIDDLDISNQTHLFLDNDSNVKLEHKEVLYIKNIFIKDNKKKISYLDKLKGKFTIKTYINNQGFIYMDFIIDENVFMNLEIRKKEFKRPLDINLEYKNMFLPFDDIIKSLPLKEDYLFKLKSNSQIILINNINISKIETAKNIYIDFENKYSIHNIKILKDFKKYKKGYFSFNISRDAPIEIFSSDNKIKLLIAPIIQGA